MRCCTLLYVHSGNLNTVAIVRNLVLQCIHSVTKNRKSESVHTLSFVFASLSLVTKPRCGLISNFLSVMTTTSAFQVLFLGTGVSTAIPNIAHVLRRSNGDDPCPVCTHAMNVPHSRNKRNNVSIALLFQEDGKQKCIVVDVGKTMRDSVISLLPKHRIEEVHGILITHGHADAVMGLDDVRDLQKVERVAVTTQDGEVHTGFRVLSGPLPIYLTTETKDVVFRVFPYLTGTPQYLDEASSVIERRVALLSYHEIDENATLDLHGLSVRCFPVWHGGQYVSLGFNFGLPGEFVYISDVKIIPEPAMQYLLSLAINVLVIDVLDREGIFSHIGLEEALQICSALKPKTVYFTGMCCELGLHDEVEKELKDRGFDNVFLAYDGLVLANMRN
ncbi:MBL fold metallo-hydrolase [archaeon]|nr:MAG: MBL fold metallo-hydrolase [archaeon]